jgi:hypothetical protein
MEKVEGGRRGRKKRKEEGRGELSRPELQSSYPSSSGGRGRGRRRRVMEEGGKGW